MNAVPPTGAGSQESARLATLRRYGILDTPPEPAFERIVAMTGRTLRVPLVAISLVDADRLWFKARLGLGVTQLPRSQSLCAHIVSTGAMLEVPDTACDLPDGTVPPEGVRCYAGAPLIAGDGHIIGTLCAMDTGPRAPLSQDERSMLTDLAASVMTEIERRLQQSLQEKASQRLALINGILSDAGGAAGLVAAIEAAISRLCRHTGAEYGHFWDLSRGGPVRLVGFAGPAPFDPAFRGAAFDAFDDVARNSDLGYLFSAGPSYLAPDVSAESVAGNPLMQISYEHGMRSFVVQQVPVGSQRYAMILKFGEPRGDLAEVSSLLAEAGQALIPALQRKQAEERLALFNEVLNYTGSASGFGPAMEAAVRQVCEHQGAMFGMVWARSADASAIRLVALNVSAALPAAWAAHAASVFPFPARNSLLAPLLQTGGRVLMPRISEEQTAVSPLLALARTHGVRSLAAQSLMVAGGRFLLVFGFGTEREDLEQVADLLAEIGQAIRPALQRQQAQDQLELINRVLALAGEADSFAAAVEGTLRLMCERLGGIFGMLWTRSADEPSIHLEVLSLGPDMTEEFRAVAEQQFPFPASRSLLADLLEREGRMVQPKLTEDMTRDFPLTAIGYRFGVRSFAAQSLAVGDTRYLMMLAFASERDDLEMTASLMAEAGAAIRPVLQRKQVQDRLALLQAAVDSTADAVLITDSTGPASGDLRVLYSNPAFTAMMGYPADAIAGRPVGILRGPDTDPGAIRLLDESVRDRRPERLELLNYRQDGTPIWLDLTTTPIYSHTKAAGKWVGVMRDISGQRANQEALRRVTRALQERTSELTEVARMARIGSWRWIVETGTLEWPDETYDLFGVAPGEFSPSPDTFFSLIHPADREMARTAGAHSIETGSDLRVEARLNPRGGRLRVIRWNAHSVRGPDGKVQELRGYCQDISAERETEAALRHGEKLRTLGELTGGISHEFNNLLTVILANLELALDESVNLSDSGPELEAARRAALAATDLTRRLLSFARADPLRSEITDLNTWLEPLRQMAWRILGSRFTVTLRTSPGVPPCAVDRPQLEAALLNLIINARDAMPRGGTIELRTGAMEVPAAAGGTPADLKPGRYAVVAVTDTGGGMPHDVAERAFEPFFTTKPSGSGSGLGLSQVLSFAQRSGGTALLESGPGEGTTVRIVLPV